MDAALSQVLVGLLTNALGGVVEKSWSSTVSIDVDAAVEAAAEDLAGSDALEAVDLERVITFLLSPEATTSVRMLFVAAVHGSTETTEDLRAAFGRAYLRAIPDAGVENTDALFDLLAASAERILTNAASTGESEAGEAIASLRFRHLSEELQGLRRSLEALSNALDEDVDAYLNWEGVYREQVLARHGTITPPTFDALERVPVDDIYVETTFLMSGGPDEPERVLSGDELTRVMDRTVVLGDPGAGKSTFGLKLAYDLARGRARVPGGSLTPLVVTLKDYGSEKQASRVSLLEWIESVANTDYAAPPPAGAIAYLLAAGRVAVIFDGLDELLDTSYRRDITADIETFAARYVAAPILVTSRRVGYAQAPLDTRRFDIARLKELDQDQIDRYVDLWFALRNELTPAEREEMAANFKRDSASTASELRSNTLMLSLLCNIYRGDGYIPRYRPQVYEKCAVMLFERWDRGRRIEVTLEFERHLRPAMQYLAFWIYAAPSLRGGVSEAALVRSATEYLVGRRFEDEDAARQEACRFVEFCRGRAWVFTDTGTAADGERLYQFTHRTFLEFFAAEHLVRTNGTPSDLGRVLGPRIEAGEWDMVAQLAFQLQDDNIDGAGDELLEQLLGDLDPGSEGDASLGFAARTLSFLVPRRETCRAVSGAVTRRALDWLQALEGIRPADPAGPAEAFTALVNSDRENFEPVAAEVVRTGLAALESDPSVQVAEDVLEVLANADMARVKPELRAGWDQVRASAFEQAWPVLKGNLANSEAITYDGFIFGAIDLDEVVRSQSPEFLFELRRFKLYGNRIHAGIAERLLRGQLGQERRPTGGALGTAEELAVLGSTLADQRSPFDCTGVFHTDLSSQFSEQPIVPCDPVLEGDALFGAFVLLAFVAENSDDGGLAELLDLLGQAPGWPRLLSPWIARRYDSAPGMPPPEPLAMESDLAGAVERWGDGVWKVTEGAEDWKR